MKFYFSFFFLTIILLNVALPLTVQFHKEQLCKMGDFGSDDADEETKKEKEKSEEKEVFSYSPHASVNQIENYAQSLRSALQGREKRLVSALYAFMPERPPEV
jgi:hypothetical protein